MTIVISFYFSTVETEALIRMLAGLLPTWIQIIKLSYSNEEYVKIDKSVRLASVHFELDQYIKKLIREMHA